MKIQSSFLSVLLLAAALILLNLVGSLIPLQVDTTEDKLYSLSPGTETILEELEEPVELRLYFSSSVEGVPVFFKNFAGRVEDLLAQYDRMGGALLQVQAIDPKPDTEDEEDAIRIGMSRQQLPSGEPFFFGLHVVQAEKETLIPFLQPDRERFLEYDISRLIYETTLLTRPRLGILTSLDMEGALMPAFVPGQPPQGTPPWLIVEELRRTYDLSFIAADDEAALDDVDVLAVIHPPRLAPHMLFAIDQFILSGKPAVLAIDPSSSVRRIASAQQSGGPLGGRGQGEVSSSDLGNLLATWGIIYDSTQVVGDLKNALQVSGSPQGTPTLNPTFIALEDLDRDSPVTGQLESVWLIEAGSLSYTPKENIEFKRMLASSDRSGSILSGSLAFVSPDQLVRQVNPDSLERTLAATLSGTFETAFPDGPPAKPESEDGDSGDDLIAALENSLVDGGADGVDYLKESSGTSRVVIIADSDFIFDEFSVRRVNMFGMESYQPYNDNLALFANIVDSLAGSQNLLNIRGKGSSTRTFDRIEDMERAAQEQFRTAQDEIEEKIGDISRQLSQLQQQQDNQSMLVASPEVLDAIESLRNEEADFRRNLREIRKTMREDIQATEITLAAVNMIVSPVVISLFGLLFFARRNQRK